MRINLVAINQCPSENSNTNETKFGREKNHEREPEKKQKRPGTKRCDVTKYQIFAFYFNIGDCDWDEEKM